MVWFRRAAAALLSLAIVVLFGGGLVALSGAVSLPATAPGISPADAEALARPFEQLMARQDEALKKSFVKEIDLSNAAATFESMRKLAPAGPPKVQRLLRWSAFFDSEGATTLSGIHEATYPSGPLRVETRIYRANATSDWKVVDLHVRFATWQELKVVQPSIFSMPPLVYVVLPLMVINVLLIWATAIACLLIDTVRRRWLWLPFILVGIGMLRVDLMGMWDFSPIYFQLCATGFTWAGSAFEPWVLSVSLPLGAILFWIFGRGRKDVAKPAAAVTPSQAT